MTDKELIYAFQNIIKHNERVSMPTALIEYKGDKGIALMLGENLVTATWLSGDIIVHWEDGEHTVLPEEFNLLKLNLWNG